jgi:hypothetical protein
MIYLLFQLASLYKKTNIFLILTNYIPSHENALDNGGTSSFLAAAQSGDKQ